MSETKVEPYLHFGGRCEEALSFYKEAVGAEVEMVMRYDEAPEMPPEGALVDGFERKVMHATFRIGGSTLMGTDGSGREEPGFNGFSLAIGVRSEEEARRVFDGLSKGGEVVMPLGKTFWSPCFGMLRDRFGVGWMVNLDTVK